MDGKRLVHTPKKHSLAKAAEILRNTLQLDAPAGTRVQIKPVLLLGTPGIGKTSLVYQLATELRAKTGHDWPVLKFRLSEVLPEDFLGIPVAVDGLTRWMPPANLPHRKNPELPDHGILFFDEINRANRMVLNAVMKVLDRDDLKPGWAIVAAGNLGTEDGTFVEDLDAAQRRRFLNLRVDFDLKVWQAWAENAGVDPIIRSFLNAHPQWANCHYQLKDGQVAHLTPAHWEELSDLKRINPKLTWAGLLLNLGDAHLGPAFPDLWDWIQSSERPTASDFFALGEDDAKAKVARTKIQKAQRPELYGMIEDVQGALKTTKVPRDSLVRSLLALNELNVLDLDTWVAFLNGLKGVHANGAKAFLDASPELSQRIANVMLGILS